MAKKIHTLANAHQVLIHRADELRARLEWHEWPTREIAIQRQKDERFLFHTDKLIGDMIELMNAKRIRKDGRKAESGSRLLLAICPACEYRVRLSAMCLMMGIPTCPNRDCERFGQEFEYEAFGPQNENMRRVQKPGQQEFAPMVDEGEETTLSKEDQDFLDKAGQW